MNLRLVAHHALPGARLRHVLPLVGGSALGAAAASPHQAEGGRRKRITKLEAMSKQLANKAAAGDPKATHLLTQLLQMCEERSERATPEAVIDESDELVIQQLFARIRELSQGMDDASGAAG